MFIDNSEKCIEQIRSLAVTWLNDSCIELTRQTQQNTVVDTGRTKDSFTYQVDEGNLTGYVGSDYQNALWEELGTGEYALNGDGRKGGWYYVDEEGNGHWTMGKHPRQAMTNAFSSLQEPIMAHLEDLLAGGGDE